MPFLFFYTSALNYVLDAASTRVKSTSEVVKNLFPAASTLQDTKLEERLMENIKQNRDFNLSDLGVF